MSVILTDFSTRLQQVSEQPELFKLLGRGIERETLRYDLDGNLAVTPHPQGLGSALTNQWITTDFSESLLEFITPVSNQVDELIAQLKDIHHFALANMNEEKLWPLSMPCFVGSQDDINLAQYGSSNVGRMKTLYRQGLKLRYGSLMQIISGVHFNFSFPERFWDALYGEQSQPDRQDTKSDHYFAMIRNYYRYGWIIPYLFGASPALCPSFIQGRETGLEFEKIGSTLYLPYATALRLSDLGYTNSAQSELKIGFNSLSDYLVGLHDAMHRSSARFAELGVKADGKHRQLNANVLQIENELYAPIRPKRVAKSGEKPSEALCRGGVEYIEVRSLDVNPFSSVGVTEQQVRFLDLFVTWCALKESAPMKDGDLECWRSNWNQVILQGRKPGLAFKLCCDQDSNTLVHWGNLMFDQLEQLAEVMDQADGADNYMATCRELRSWVQDATKTTSAQVLEGIRQAGGIGKFGCQLGLQYRQQLLDHQYQVYNQQMMEQEVQRSRAEQQQIEQSDRVSFDDYLNDYFAYLK